MSRGEQEPPARPDAVVFDFDGVLFDTERLHHAAFFTVLEPFGLGMTWDEYAAVYIGFDDRGVFRERFRRAGERCPDERLAALVAAKGAAFAQEARSTALAPYPGVTALLAALTGAAVPVAVCTGALPADIEPILARSGLSGVFEVRVTAADVAVGKPDPAGYRLALERLAARGGAAPRPAASVAVEDTPAGIEAARGAGLRVLAVTTTASPGALTAADAVAPALDRVSLKTLSKLVSCTV